MDPGFSKLLETGVLGILVVILLNIVKNLYGTLIAEKDKRIADAQQATNHVTLTIENNNEILKAILVAVENDHKEKNHE